MFSTGARHLLALLLTLTVLLGAAVMGGAAAFADETQSADANQADEDRQLALIESAFSGLKQPDGETVWYYTVTDLDHNGRLELIAASQHPQSRATNLHVWEVSADRSALAECALAKDAGESFPDILTDASDTYFSAAAGAWHYLFYDHVVLSDTEVYTVKTAVTLKDGTIGYVAYATEHTVVTNGSRDVTHTDANGAAITPEQYNAAGHDALAGTARSSTNFEWLTADKAADPAKLADSYQVFMGRKAASEDFPVPQPAALSASPTPAPAPQSQVYLTITKNPTNENHTEGETAYFVAAASAYESLSWTFIAPDGREYPAQTMQSMWGTVSGQNSTSLSVANVTTAMNGWGAYCTFYYMGQTARTATAWLYVSARQTPPAGDYDGTVTDYSDSSVTIDVENTVTTTISRGICDIDGELYVGAYATLYWDGRNVTYCHVYGSQPTPGSMDGNAYEGGGGYAIDLANGSQVYADAWLCSVSGTFYSGAPCVVYYTGSPSAENITHVDIYGSDDPSGPIVGVMYCPHCGAELPVTRMDYCPYCGWPLWDDDDDPDDIGGGNVIYDPDGNGFTDWNSVPATGDFGEADG